VNTRGLSLIGCPSKTHLGLASLTRLPVCLNGLTPFLKARGVGVATVRPHTEVHQGSLSSRKQTVNFRLQDVATHRLGELRVNLIRDHHHRLKNLAEVHSEQIVLQGLEDADL
jgi:hypothetical protein